MTGNLPPVYAVQPAGGPYTGTNYHAVLRDGAVVAILPSPEAAQAEVTLRKAGAHAPTSR